MDLQVEQKGVGLLVGKDRCWLFIDGFFSLGHLTRGVWTLQHRHGYVIHIPMTAITEDQLAHFGVGIALRNRPEHIQEVIERGRVIQLLQAEKRREAGENK